MQLTIALTTLLNIFATVSTLCGDVVLAAEDPVPDLCTEDVYLDPDGVPLEDSDGTTLSRDCVWTGEADAPIWADEVCCEFGPDSVFCTPTNALGECAAMQVKRWCDYAKFDGEQVTCLQPFPSACDAGVCAEPPLGVQPNPEAHTPLCCYGGACYELSYNEFCGGSFKWCDSPYTNADGTVGCAD